MVRGVASTSTIDMSFGPPAMGEEVVALLERAVRTRGGAPLVYVSDNGPPYRSAAVATWCAEHGVLHLFSLPRTPQHNAASDHGMCELEEDTLIGKGTRVVDTDATLTALQASRDRIDAHQLRRTRGWRTAVEADRVHPNGNDLTSRKRVLEEVACGLEQAALYSKGRRARRRAIHEAILGALERRGVITRTRGGRPWAAQSAERVFEKHIVTALDCQRGEPQRCCYFSFSNHLISTNARRQYMSSCTRMILQFVALVVAFACSMGAGDIRSGSAAERLVVQSTNAEWRATCLPGEEGIVSVILDGPIGGQLQRGCLGDVQFCDVDSQGGVIVIGLAGKQHSCLGDVFASRFTLALLAPGGALVQAVLPPQVCGLPRCIDVSPGGSSVRCVGVMRSVEGRGGIVRLDCFSGRVDVQYWLRYSDDGAFDWCREVSFPLWRDGVSALLVAVEPLPAVGVYVCQWMTRTASGQDGFTTCLLDESGGVEWWHEDWGAPDGAAAELPRKAWVAVWDRARRDGTIELDQSDPHAFWSFSLATLQWTTYECVWSQEHLQLDVIGRPSAGTWEDFVGAGSDSE